MVEKQPAWASNPRIVEELRTQYYRVKAAVSAARLWEQILTERDRRRLGGDLEAIWKRLGTVGMWSKLHGVSQEQAILELGHKLGWLEQTKYEWLLREIGIKAGSSSASLIPEWNSSTGELRWQGQVVCRIRIMGKPSNIQAIAAAFQEEDWSGRIQNPLRGGQEQLHQSLRSLNKGLKKIRFHAHEGGHAITWQIL
jgi:hypothetical protein